MLKGFTNGAIGTDITSQIEQYSLASSLAIPSSSTVYSTSIPFEHCSGYAAALVTVAGDGSLTITQQCSLDDTTFYDAVNASNSSLGAVASAMTVGSRYIHFDPVPTPYMRLKIVEGIVSNATVTITLITQE